MLNLQTGRNYVAPNKYEAGALENAKSADPTAAGIRESVCDILEGGKGAFRSREQKYRLEQ
ncbi:MAG: hypothetical protein SGJ18_11185 [Pseudomonadota bacterium]|nr:hypothetical protein [Pseudomonadota bacterium]